MVTDLLQSNRQLRDSINMLNKEKENIENDNCILQSDNLELRDRIEILESIIRANASEYENYDWRKIIEEENELNLESFKSNGNKGVENVASTMIEIKKENRMLKRRIEHLELQISHLTNHFDFQGNIEPTRAMVNQMTNEYNDGTDDMMPEPIPINYYDRGAMNSNPGMNYTNGPNSQNMRSTGFKKGTRTKIGSKSSLRESGQKRAHRPDVTIRNGKKKSLKANSDYSMNINQMADNSAAMYGDAPYMQGQGSYSDHNNMMLLKSNAGVTDKDEALKMLYDMMMTRVNKKRRTNY